MNNEETKAAVLFPEPCPAPFRFQVDGCQDAASVELPEVRLQSQGRMVQVDVTLKSICPGKRVAVAVLLTQLDAQGTAQPRGIKHLLIPAQTGEGCQDLTLRCITFAVPEELNTEGGLCAQRTFQVQVFANYVDTEFACCDTLTAEIS